MRMRRFVLPVAMMCCGCVGYAQQPIGSVGVQDATVAGALEVTNGRAVLVGSTTVTAKDHTAEVALSRGGVVKVCSTSGLHITAGKSAAGPQPLMLALDRGAIEVRMAGGSSDVVMTPDLRFALRGEGPLELELRVTRNGDTCVENRGAGAPTLSVADQFGEGTYELRAGQHVLFEHGSLKEVVDHESSPCGCPAEVVVSVADAGVTSATPAAVGSVVAAQQAGGQQAGGQTDGAPTTAAQTAEAQHPFPAAVSEGLAPGAEVPQAPPGVAHAQVATTLRYGAGADAAGGEAAGNGAGNVAGTAAGSGDGVSGVEARPAAGAVGGTERAQAAPEPAAPSAGGIRHRIGHFFKRLFGRG